MKPQISDNTKALYKAILSLKDEEECRAFFQDICTIKEQLDLEQRLEVAILLDKGMNYQEISEGTGVSSATISRVNRCLIYGEGGYKLVIERMKESEESS